MGVCCTERQSSTYPVSICFLGTPSIVSPWPWLTLNFCPNEPLHNITQSKAIKLLDAIWSPFVVLNNNQALYVMHSSRKLCRVYETPRQLTASVAWSALSKRFLRVTTVTKKNLNSKPQWSTCSQLSSSISQGVDCKRSKLCWFYIVPLNPAQIDRKRECLTRNRIHARWLVVKFDTYTHCVCYSLLQKASNRTCVFRLTLSASNFKLMGHYCLFSIFLTQKLATDWCDNGLLMSPRRMLKQRG